MPYPTRTARAVRLLSLLICAATLTTACPLPAHAFANHLQSSSAGSSLTVNVDAEHAQSSMYISRLALYRSIEA